MVEQKDGDSAELMAVCGPSRAISMRFSLIVINKTLSDRGVSRSGSKNPRHPAVFYRATFLSHTKRLITPPRRVRYRSPFSAREMALFVSAISRIELANILMRAISRARTSSSNIRVNGKSNRFLSSPDIQPRHYLPLRPSSSFLHVSAGLWRRAERISINTDDISRGA